jgi:hypothetical protein
MWDRTDLIKEEKLTINKQNSVHLKEETYGNEKILIGLLYNKGACQMLTEHVIKAFLQSGRILINPGLLRTYYINKK